MCIRDSLEEAQRMPGAEGLQDRRVAGDADRAERAERQEPEPVSYTHLRAHETVLDLVCRLLLEKKTQQKKNKKQNKKNKKKKKKTEIM